MSDSFKSKSSHEIRNWINTGIIAGLIACISYPLAIFISMPSHQLTLVVAGSFGPALIIASIALGKILLDRNESVVSQLGVVSNVIAGTLVTAMIIVQLAVRYSTVPSQEPELETFVVNRIWDVVLGLDVAFDIFIGLGTIFFGIAMLRDARFGKIVGTLGILIGGIVILGFNIYSFPTPPKDAGLFDPGPVSGVWYTIVTIQIIYFAIKERKKVGAS
jgi:hypothetical protein